MIRDLIQRLLGRSDIYFNGSLYMRRWRAIHTRWFGIRVHHIVRSDDDREMHDHPFSFVSVILKGGYVEHRPGCRCLRAPDGGHLARVVGTGCRFRRPGSFVFRRAEDLHRLDLKREVSWIDGGGAMRVVSRDHPAWTLVFRGPVRREWGFQTAAGWVPWFEFVASRDGKGTAAGPFAAESSL